MTLTVLKPGLLTSVQDLGRPHAAASGVTPGGAMDRFAHSAANLLVGNDRSAATLECTIAGPTLTTDASCVVAVTGADLDARLNGEPAPAWTSFSMRPGDELSFAARRSGARAYIAVAGGIQAARWLGSMSTDLMVGRGGVEGRALRRGDVLTTGEAPFSSPGRTLAAELRPAYGEHTLHTIAGPQADRLGAASRAALFGATFTVSVSSNRMGFRLDGPLLEAAGDELLSFHVVAGAVQLPAGGRPILLMAGHQTAGGYPVVAVVVSASMPVAAQLAPGDELRFEEVAMDRALAMRAAQREALESLISWM
jgi:antagonist of KipI